MNNAAEKITRVNDENTFIVSSGIYAFNYKVSLVLSLAV